MTRLLATVMGIFLSIAAFAQEGGIVQFLHLDDDVHKVAVHKMDFNANGRIDPGDEAHAVVRYVNDTIFQNYDKNHDGKLVGDEASRYVETELQPKLNALDKYFNLVAYPEADKRFAWGIPTMDSDTVLLTAPFTPRFEKIALSIGYGDKEETGKETKSLVSAFEYKWGRFALRQTPIAVGTKVSYSREDTFLLAETNKVERCPDALERV
jgi:hypothetical protein